MKIIEIELLSDTLSETENFYTKNLGVKVYAKSNSSLTFRLGFTKLIFRKSVNAKPVYHFALDVPNNRFEEAYKAIKQKVPLLPIKKGSDIADFSNWDAKSFYFIDNNGNIVEIITRYGNRAFSDEPFTANSYLSVSEIGIVTNDVPQLAATLRSEYGISAFHRQPPGEKFTVCGDDDGLFILAEKGRDWYPTTVKAQSFHPRILFMDKGNLYHIIR